MATETQTQKTDYTEYLVGNEAPWKKALDVQRVYRNHLKGLKPGRVLDVGCGLGRHLWHLQQVSPSVGVDHNAHSIEIARSRGLNAFTPDDFHQSEEAKPESFDTILLAHVVEHLTPEQARGVLNEYLPYLRPGGRVILMTPQELGFKSDKTHVTFMDFAQVKKLVEDAGLQIERQYSFPFPRAFGGLFKYNEFLGIARKAA